jgi:hypothetical protein
MTTPPPLEIDPDDPPSEEELRVATELRDALSDPSRDHVDADFARAIVRAHSPASLDPAEHAKILARALAPKGRVSLEARARSARLSKITVGAGALALAAVVLLFARMNPDETSASSDARPTPVYARSTQALFREPFAAEGGESARIDRIAMARQADLRENLFKRWDGR